MTTAFEQAKARFLEGVQCYEAGRYDDAEAHFRRSLALVPERPSTLSNLAATCVRLGRPQEALNLLKPVLAQSPEDRDAWAHQAAALDALGRHEEALGSHRRALALDAGHIPSLFHCGVTLQRLRRHDEARAMFETLLKLVPDHAGAWFHHGVSLQHLERHDDALVSYERALAADPGRAAAWSHRGGILKDIGRRDEAANCFEQAIALGGDPELNGYFLASLRGGAMPLAAPREYVRQLFDDYADSFDDHLVGVLRYRAHEQLVGTLEAMHVGPFRRALDLGCGTGLCGPLLRPLAQAIDGVDLAARMLDQARARDIYEELIQADIAEHLHATPQRYDLLIAADVFIYIGALEVLFQGARRVMDTGGIFCFSVEAAKDGVDFELRPSQRYAHSERYLRALAAEHHFEVASLTRQTVREDQRQPIDGYCVHLRAA